MLSQIARQARRQVTVQRSMWTSAVVRSEGAPSGSGQSSFNKREHAAEEQYAREAEHEKLLALKKSIEASKKHLEELQKNHAELEASLEKK